MTITLRATKGSALTHEEMDANMTAIYAYTKTVSGATTGGVEADTDRMLRYDRLVDDTQNSDSLYDINTILHMSRMTLGQGATHRGSALLQSQHMTVLNSDDGAFDATVSWREFGWLMGSLNAKYTANGAANLYTNGGGNYWLFDLALHGPAVAAADAATTSASPIAQLSGANIHFRNRSPFKTGGTLGTYGQGDDAAGKPYWGVFGLHLSTFPKSGANYDSADATAELSTYPLVSLIALQGFSGPVGTGSPTTGSAGAATHGAIAALQIGTGGIFGAGFWAPDHTVGSSRSKFKYGAFIADYDTYGIYLDDALTGGNAIYVHADAGSVGIHTAPDSALPLLVRANTTSRIAARLTSGDAGASAGPVLQLHRDSASPAASDVLGQLQFIGKDSGGNETTYGMIHFGINDPTDASEDGKLFISNFVAGASRTIIADDGVDMNVTSTGSGQNRSLNVIGFAGATQVTTKVFSSSGGVGIVGTSTNHDLQLRANDSAVLTLTAAGVVKFGTWTTNADAAVNGYVTIQDAAGNSRKLATIA